MAAARVQQIFSDSQRTTATHPKLIKNLVKVYRQSDFGDFFREFSILLKKSLIYGDKQPAVDRTLSFVAKFATAKKDEQDEKSTEEAEKDEEEAEEEADPFLVKLIQFLLNNHEANNQAVRYRVCQLINILLGHMGQEAVIEDELYNSIYDTMLHRLQDKVPAVRVQAVMAVARLQDPRNKECPVIKAYRYHLSMDQNYDVRRAVLINIAITYQTLPDILERTRDVRDLVRRQAYLVISQRVHLKSLTIAQRVRLISEGLKDRSEMVRACVEKKLIQAWLRMVHANVLDLLTCLDVEASVTEAELAIKAIFRDVPYPNLMNNFGLDKDQRIVLCKDLRPESALYWRCLAQHLRNEGAEEALDTILPELTAFCKYLSDYVMAEEMDTGDEQEMAVRGMERDFVMKQLISMTMLYDLADEVGRRSLDQLVRTLLVSDKVGESLVKGLVEVFGKIHPPNARVTQLAEIISEVRDPVCKSAERPLSEEEQRKRKLQVARVKVKINQVKEELEECVRSLDLERAKVLKEELEGLETEIANINMDTTSTEEVVEERKDARTLSKCLTIVCNMVECGDITVMNPTLHSLHENLVLLCLRSEDPAVRNGGVRALGLFCLLSKDLAHKHITLLMQISRIDVEQIQMTALRFVIDMLHIYGLEEFIDAAEDLTDPGGDASPSRDQAKEDEIEEEGGAIISALCQMMDAENSDVRTLVAEGLCKLLVARRITSSKLLSRLILMWYNPATEDESLLRHMLGVFFPLYAQYGGSNQESLCDAVLPTLHTLFKAPVHSPLADVDVDDVANFLISITSPAIIAEKEDKVNVHDTLVFSLCTDILAFPESTWSKVLLRCLNHLHLTPTNFSTLRQVKVLALKIMKKVKEKAILNAVNRFHHSLEALLKDAPEQDAEEANAEATTDMLNEDGDESAGDGTYSIDNTQIRKKRMLYNQTVSDLEVFSSEPESDMEGSPTKRPALISSFQNLDSDISDVGTPQSTRTRDATHVLDKSLRVQLVRLNVPPSDAELELTPGRVEAGDGEDKDLFASQDMFESPKKLDIQALQDTPTHQDRRTHQDTPSHQDTPTPQNTPTHQNIAICLDTPSHQNTPIRQNTPTQQDTPSQNTPIQLGTPSLQKTPSPQDTSSSQDTSTAMPRSNTDEDEESSSSVGSGRRRSKKETSTGHSSEEESTPPTKIRRKNHPATVSRECSRRLKIGTSGSSASDSSQVTPTGRSNQLTVQENSDDANSDSSVFMHSSRSTRSRAVVQPASVALARRTRGRPKKSTQGSSFEDTNQSSSAKESASSQIQTSSTEGTPQRTRSVSQKGYLMSKALKDGKEQVFSPLAVKSLSSEDSMPVRRSPRNEMSSVGDSDSTSTEARSLRSTTTTRQATKKDGAGPKKQQATTKGKSRSRK